MDAEELTGRKKSHIKEYRSLHLSARPDAAKAFSVMKESAAEEGMELFPASSFRDFQSQLAIWNDKCSGKRTVYDRQGNPVDPSSLSRRELTRAILRWSALPGASRHHWGTDMDVIDLKAIPEDYQVKLTPEETGKGGIFYKLRLWLDDNLERFGFFRPYARFQNGVFPEPWHISFKEPACRALESLSLKIVEKSVRESDILEKTTILESLPEIYENYIANISS